MRRWLYNILLTTCLFLLIKWAWTGIPDITLQYIVAQLGSAFLYAVASFIIGLPILVLFGTIGVVIGQIFGKSISGSIVLGILFSIPILFAEEMILLCIGNNIVRWFPSFTIIQAFILVTIRTVLSLHTNPINRKDDSNER